ncbi:leukocyte immunoglobulin-like receptor subfamily A member 3 [Pygocentrus nattereri]|uniref:Ig-like domain-containing protein n=1 Tax=Pygocentrus nattereri TaxID=42514 RepID=A0A3B4E5N7_PYGNA|nr:leukocyte immunoglobulin-like receptor subfamily A member 3 [Pygocentrus nattereri]
MEFRSLSVILWLIVFIHYGQTQDLPKPTLTVEPESSVFSGESVTLKCEIKGYDGWTYQWYKQDKQSRWSAVSQSEYYTVNRDTLTIRADAVIHGDQYRCSGERHDRLTSSQYSDFVTLTINALPRATLYIVEPESPVYTGGSVTLKCEINTYDEWTFQWYKQDKQHRWILVSQAEYYTVNRDTLTIREHAVIHGDPHLCRGERRDRPKVSQYSNSVALPVNALPTATLTVEPEGPVFTGGSVTLKCEIQSHSNWRYQWYKGSSRTAVSQSETNTFTIRSAADQDQYWCRGERDDRPSSSQPSNTVTLTVKGEAKAVLSIKPDKHVFRGEAVTLRCDIQWGRDTECKYSWYKEANTLYSSSTTQEFRFSPAEESHSGNYTCSGEDIGNSGYSQSSDAVTLTVTGLPRATLTVEPEGPVFSGESVTLKCEIQSHSNWRYQWYKGSRRTAVSQSQTNTFTIRSAADQDQDQYWCRGERDYRPTSSQPSNTVTLTVKDTSPEVSLMVSPSRAQHFITDSLSLSCEGQSDSTGRRVRRYTHSEKVSDCSSGWGSVTGSTCSISSLSTSHTGVYWCESESGESSNPVNISVTNGAVILDSPVHPMTEGDTLTLRCLYHDPKPSNLTAEFYKNGSLLQTQTIHTVSKSDEGLYHCKHPERGESPQSWISVKGLLRSEASFSVLSLLSRVMAASPYLLVSIILGLKCYKARGEN